MEGTTNKNYENFRSSGPYERRDGNGGGMYGGSRGGGRFDSLAGNNAGRPSFNSRPSSSSFGSNYSSGSRYGPPSRGGSGSFGSGSFGGSSSSRGGSNALVPVDWSQMRLAPFEKAFYSESDAVMSMSRGEVEEFRRKHEIRVMSGGDVPKPVREFTDIAVLPKAMLQSFYDCGFKSPSAIQSQAWPIALSGRDMIGIAETGSGKTLAFLLPAVVHIRAQQRIARNEGPIVLIVAPTRELIDQIKREADKFAGSMGVRCGVAYGGVSRREQMYDLRNGCEIVAACPGRLIDFMERGDTNMNRCTFLVLDEADRMLDMGFEPQIKRIVGQIRPDRQTLMFSATWPREVQALARDLCREDPVHITIGSTDLKASHNVEQHIEVVSGDDKRSRLMNLLEHLERERSAENVARTLIFVETKRRADDLTVYLRTQGINALCIHGDKEQPERTWVLDEFRKGNAPILIATDVASRGLDIKDVKVVINYDMPNQIEDYVHRIGRTGRAGAKGKSFSFVTADKARLARDLCDILREASQPIPPELSRMATEGGHHMGGSGGFGRMNSNGFRGGGGRSFGGGNRRW